MKEERPLNKETALLLYEGQRWYCVPYVSFIFILHSTYSLYNYVTESYLVQRKLQEVYISKRVNYFSAGKANWRTICWGNITISEPFNFHYIPSSQSTNSPWDNICCSGPTEEIWNLALDLYVSRITLQVKQSAVIFIPVCLPQVLSVEASYISRSGIISFSLFLASYLILSTIKFWLQPSTDFPNPQSWLFAAISTHLWDH